MPEYLILLICIISITDNSLKMIDPSMNAEKYFAQYGYFTFWTFLLSNTFFFHKNSKKIDFFFTFFQKILISR